MTWRVACWFLVLLALDGPVFGQTPSKAIKLRPPAVPLVLHDPYFSIWSPADRLTDSTTTHWTGRPHPLRSLLRVDGQTVRVMGVDPPGTTALPQVEVSVLPTRTIYRFADKRIGLTLTFLTPALPWDQEVLSRPVTYLVWDVQSVDGQPHSIQLYFDCGSELAVNTSDQTVVASVPAVKGLSVLKLGSGDQPVLARKGDDVRIDWGYLYLAASETERPKMACVDGVTARRLFAETGSFVKPRVTTTTPPVLAAVFDLGRVGSSTATRWFMLAYDDVRSIQYFDAQLQPYWRRAGMEAAELLRRAAQDYPRLAATCPEFDDELMRDLTRVGGERYALLCALVYRQTLAGNKLTADASGHPLLFPKENFSNGCISTVDVLFPQAPFFLVFSPKLTRAMLVPILDYASSPRWPYPYAPHDLGTYPHATGQVYGMNGGDGGRMPVEESGNMLIMLAALSQVEGNADMAKAYWPTLARWADYLVANGLDPENQLCSADMFGHLPHCANLALKAVIGIGGYAQLCARAGKAEEARKFMAIARKYAASWQARAADEGRTRLAYHLPGSWGMKHNLIWDRVLGLNLFPNSVGDAEIAWYHKVQNGYGLPVDNRTTTSLIDWALWSIAPARHREDFDALLAPIFRYVNDTPSRVPLSDWFTTTDGRQKGFQARPVVGGLFIRLLADQNSWKSWAGRSSFIRSGH